MRTLPVIVVFDFDAFDWTEEDEPVFSHPRDPFSRVDARRSSRHVRIERDGVLLAESRTPTLVFETKLYPRFYLPREDVKAEMLPSDMVTACPIQGPRHVPVVRGRGESGLDLPRPAA
jgi:uncharacterized protein (DUF427 family)